MEMYDEKVLKCFLDNQLKLYPKPVCSDLDEAADFLDEAMAVVIDNAEDVQEYMEEVGVDTEGMSMQEILSQPEVFEVGDGRYLVLEV